MRMWSVCAHPTHCIEGQEFGEFSIWLDVTINANARKSINF